MPSHVLPATDEITSSVTTPQSITLSNGNVLVYGPGTIPGAGTVGRLFSPDGSALGEIFQLGANYGGELNATALDGGGFALAYRVHNGLYAMRLFDNGGAVQSGPIAVNPDEFGVIVTGIHLTTLTNGNVAATWSGTGIDAQIFDPTGAAIGSKIDVGAYGLEPGVTAQAHGAFTVIWRNTAAGSIISGQKVTSAGALDGSIFTISTTPNGITNSHPGTATLANGDIVVSWLVEDPSPDGGPMINLKARIIHTDGSMSDVLEVTRAELSTDLTRVRGNANETPDVIALPGGGFVVGWSNTDFAAGVTDRDAYFAAFDGNGLRLSENVLMSPSAAGQQNYPALAAAGDDGFFSFWDDGTHTGSRLFTATQVAGTSQTGTTNADALTGSDGNDILVGLGGADTLDGLGGADRMTGGADDDTYHVDHRYDLVVETAGQGNDTVIASASYYLTLGSSVETMRTIDPNATDTIDLRGNALTQTIIGNAGANLLDGGGNTVAGSWGDFLGLTPSTPDTLIGGAGDDTYVVYRIGDVVTELADGGGDTVLSWISFTLSAELENLSLVGRENLSATGNSGDNILRGNGGGNWLYGLAGNDVLDGGEGNDAMTGSLGDDTYYVDMYGDVVTELAGEGTDTIRTTFSYTLGEGAAIEILATVDSSATNSIHLTGNSDANTLIGNAANNTLDGKVGADTMMGLDGNDTYYVDNAADQVIEGAAGGVNDRILASVSYTLAAGAEIEQLGTTDAYATGAINFTGNEFDNSITGNAGANLLDGGAGADTLVGLSGNDWYYVDNAADSIAEGAGEGVDDRAFASVSYALSGGVQVEKLWTTNDSGTAAIDLAGNEFANDIRGNAGANVLDGKGGADTMAGLGGDDSYTVDNTGDKVNEAANAGTDRVLSSISFELGANLENLTLTGSGSTSGAGNALANVLTGNDGNNWLVGLAGNDTLDGGLGIDRMEGGADNDTYYVDNTGDRANEAVNAGTDLILASVGFELGANVENLTLTGSGNLSGAGNALANLLTGNSGNNWLVGLAGNDTLDGGLGADRMEGGGDNDTYIVDNASDRATENANQGTDLVLASVGFELGANVENLTLTGNGNLSGAGNAIANVLTGNAGNNWLIGRQGNDTLDGGLGADRMEGGADNDTYYVDNALDRVTENASEGADLVLASVSFELGANVENLTLMTGSGNTNGGGNALANVLTGNSGNNWLVGLAGNDTLDGGLGADRMEGGADNDTYRVENVNDRVTERVNEGVDLVQSTINFELGANVENLTLTGSGNLSGAGNSLANALTGNNGNNWLVGSLGNDVLDGGLGADKLDGGANDDTYYVDNAGDRANEKLNEGTDQVFASVTFELGANVENLTLTGSGNTNGGGSAVANVMIGNTGDNWLVGLAGNDMLDGGLGADRLDGGADQDVFAFTTALGGGNIDRISGFVAADDTIQLANAVFTGLAAGALAVGAFNTGAAATQADDRVIYNSNTGALLFDADGLGGAAAVQFATLGAGLTITAADFLVI